MQLKICKSDNQIIDNNNDNDGDDDDEYIEYPT